VSAYVISEVEARDPVLFEQYRTLAGASVAQYGGRYLVRGGKVEVVEGGPPAKTIIIVEFPSSEQMHAWYRSTEYAQALAVRQHALERRLMFVEGVPQQNQT
jgi:uncharacterized protein (DUF1330 family)